MIFALFLWGFVYPTELVFLFLGFDGVGFSLLLVVRKDTDKSMFEELIRSVFLELLVSLRRAVCGTAYAREVAIATFAYTGDSVACGLPPSCPAGPSTPATSESASVGLPNQRLVQQESDRSPLG